MYQRQFLPMPYGPTLSMDSALPTLPIAEPQQSGGLPMPPIGLLQSFGGGGGLLGGEGAGGVLGGEGFAGMGAMASEHVARPREDSRFLAADIGTNMEHPYVLAQSYA